MASDDLDAPLGKKPKRKTLNLPVTPPQIVAGLLGMTVVIVALWTAIADDPYGGEPIAVVATRLTTANAKDHDIAAAAGKPGEKIMPAASAAPAPPATEKAPPPGSKVVTITDGSTGKAQQVVVPPRAGDKLAAMAADPKLLEDSRHGQIPKVGADGKRASLAYAKPVNAASRSDAPKIAIVVGGLGVSGSVTEDALTKLPGPVTLAFVPYGGDLDNLSARARATDHEVLLQAPMEPFDYPDNDPGPQTLLTTLTPDQNIDRLHWLMARMQGYVGVVSFMGARFTASDAAIAPVLREVGKRGLIYLDDGTSTRSIAGQAAGALNLPFVKADIVLDANPLPAEIGQALARLELMAKQRGGAIGFAKGTAASVAKISEWAKGAQARGFVLVPISMMVAKPKST